MRHLVFIAALSMIGSTSIAAQQIYRWVDDQGITHFSAQPPQDKDATRIEAKAPSPGPASAPSSNKNRNNSLHDPEQDALDEKIANELLAQEAEIDKFCKQNRENLAQLRNNPRLRYTDDDGQMHAVTDEIRQQRIVEAEQNIKDFCQ